MKNIILKKLLNNTNGLERINTNIDLINIYKSSRYLEPINFNDSDTLLYKIRYGNWKIYSNC